MDTLFVINAPSVVSEVIDGEVIIMNVKSGNYYSSAEVGAVVWSWIEQGRTKDQMRGLATARYQGDDRRIGESLEAFFESLLREELVRAVPVSQTAPAPDQAAGENGAAAVFTAPKLCAYTDMQDLLFLDPIHDVDAIGWPEAKDAKLG
jgi:coenzyme PQQ synthesis protein D (PqqD)